MNEQELTEVRESIRREVRYALTTDMQEIRLIKERLDAILDQQKQKIDEMDEFFIEYSHEQKKNQQNYLDSLKIILAEHKKIADEAKSLYKDISNNTQEMRLISTQHQEKLSSYYDYLFLKVFGIAAMGGLFALFLYLLFFRFIYPFINRLL
jgi:rubrerythrin